MMKSFKERPSLSKKQVFHRYPPPPFLTFCQLNWFISTQFTKDYNLSPSVINVAAHNRPFWY